MGPGTELENVAHIQRQHDGKKWENENRARGDERNHAKNRAIVAHVVQAFLETGLPLLFFLRRPDRAWGQRSQRNNQGEEKVAALQKNAEAAPHHPTNIPASDGPTRREP